METEIENLTAEQEDYVLELAREREHEASEELEERVVEKQDLLKRTW